jgi:hypothetical protein
MKEKLLENEGIKIIKCKAKDFKKIILKFNI